MKLNFLIYILAALFLSNNSSIASQLTPKLILTEPKSVKMRHQQDVKLLFKDWQKGTQLSISPGGAYIQSNLNLKEFTLVASSNDFTWLASKNEIRVHNNEKNLPASKTIRLNENFTNIALADNYILTSSENKIKLYIINNSHELTLYFSTAFNEKVKQLSLSESHACLLIEDNSIIQISLTSKAIIQSKSQEQNFSSIKATNSSCLSANSNNQVLLWTNLNNELQISSTYQLNDLAHHMDANGNTIILANGNTGVTILEIRNNILHWLGSYNKLGNITLVANYENLTLAADTRGALTLLDISQPTTPLLISDFHLHDQIHDMTFNGETAYVFTQQNILHSVNFDAESPPTISTLGVNQGGSRRSFIKDNILYVADWFSGMHLYDISIPRSPRLLSSHHTPGSPKGVVVKDNIAFIADDDHGLQIVDVSDPAEPKFVSNLSLSGLAYTMKLVDNLLYIAAHRGGFHIVDVSDTAKPKLLSTYDTPSKAWALEYREGLLYVADDSTGLMIFDVKNSSFPKLISQFNPGGFAEDVILKNNKAYIAFFDLGLIIVDISDPLNPKQLSHLQTPGNARGIEIVNDLLYLASWEAGVHIIDISDDNFPKIKGHYDTKGAVWGLSVKNDYLYAMDWWGGVKVLNINSSTNPLFIGKYHSAGRVNDLLFHNNFIYAAHGSRGLQVYDANNSLNPVWATGVDFDGDARNVAISNKLAFVAAGDGGLVIVNIENPFEAKWLSQLAIPTSADLVQIIEDFAFVATENGDLFIIDISELAQPKLINRIKSKTQSIKSQNNDLFHLKTSSSIDKYSVKKMSKKLKVEQFKINNKAHFLEISNQSLFLATKNGKINRLHINQGKLSNTANINLGEALNDIYIHHDRLYATTKNSNLYVFNINQKDSLQLQSIYPSTHEINQISASNNGIFFSGENTIASAKLLPDVKITQKNNHFIANIPNNMPLGAYNINILTPNGTQNTEHNAFEVNFPKLKSKFTLEDLKRKMTEKNLSGKANTASPKP